MVNRNNPRPLSVGTRLASTGACVSAGRIGSLTRATKAVPVILVWAGVLGVGTVLPMAQASAAVADLPATPGKPVASDGTSMSQVDLSWAAVDGASAYKVYRCPDPTTANCGGPVAAVSGSSWGDGGASAGGLYYYRLKACNSQGCSAIGKPDAGWRKFLAPQNVSASDNQVKQVTVTWSAPGNVGAVSPVYQVYRSDSAQGVKSLLNAGVVGGSLSYVDTTAVPSTTYWYWVKACAAEGSRCSAMSSDQETGVALAVAPTPSGAVLALPFTTVEIDQEANRMRLRKLLVPDVGFKTGVFAWDAAQNAWVLNGKLTGDDKYFGVLQLWQHYGQQATAQSEKLSLFAGGLDVTAVQFKSPDGAVHDNLCTADGTFSGLNMFACDTADLPVGQTAYAPGKYVVRYQLGSGGTVSRTFYISGNYPTGLAVAAPGQGATGISVTPTVKWTAYGATGYDFILRDADQNEIYGASIPNAIDSSLSHTVPAGVLQPNSRYYLTIEANGPVVNGGTKGIKKTVEFTTAP